jgi:hypothetical protein
MFDNLVLRRIFGLKGDGGGKDKRFQNLVWKACREETSRKALARMVDNIKIDHQ